jgi:hypothetical protein
MTKKGSKAWKLPMVLVMISSVVVGASSGHEM